MHATSLRLGVFGGSFDPVHYGHLLLAECCREQCRLDQVCFVPAASPPHKHRELAARGTDRARMLELAIADHDRFHVSNLELSRGGVSYTVDTLAAIRREQPDAEMFLLLGSDSLVDLPNWKNAAEICRLATPAVVWRRDTPRPDYSVLAGCVEPVRLKSFEDFRVDMPSIELSSTEIRRRIASGRSVRYQTPPAVIQFIAERALYRRNEND
jgi:nicotinate-nucleotide adenylyltransferase